MRKILFVVLGKFKGKPTRESVDATNKYIEKLAKEGVVFKAMYWTLGRYDTIGVFEAPNELAAMKAMMGVADIAKTETLTAVSRAEAAKIL